MDLTTNYDEVKVVCDNYEKNSLKTVTRVSRNAGIAPVSYIVDDQTNTIDISMSQFFVITIRKID